MTAQLGHHEHDFSYLLKVDSDGRYFGRVLQVPAVIAQGRTQDEVEKKITSATKDYLDTFVAEHKKLIRSKPKSILTSSGIGTILGTKPFKVQC